MPGYHGDDQDPALLAREAGKIGFPVLIKASAGGGGKGMRRVDKGEDFAAALASCQREAKSAFGDDRVLVEQYVLKPRHIEIQVFADSLGHCVYLFERDCSVQRRHQKVLEEAPAPGMTAERRAAMGQAAVEAAQGGRLRRRRYGRVHRPPRRPLLLHGDEHAPAGRAPGDRDDHRASTWSSGSCASRPASRCRGRRTSSPSPATRSRRASTPRIPTRASCRRPGGSFTSRRRAQSDSVRVDTGVEQGDAITPFYDPMIAKLIVHAPDRAGALARMNERARAVPDRRRRQQRRVPRPPGRERLVRARRSRHRADRARARRAVPARRRSRPTTRGCSPRSPRSSAMRRRRVGPPSAPSTRHRRGERSMAGA